MFKSIRHTGLLILLISCSQNEIIEVEKEPTSNNHIDFSISVDQTRGVSFNNDNFDSFGLFANFTTDDMTNITPSSFDGYNLWVKRLLISGQPAGRWSYSPTLEWQENRKTSFFAYAPYEITPTLAGAQNIEITLPTYGFPTMRFTQNETVSSQKDLLVGNVLNAVPNTLNSKVNISMQHLLAQLNFYFRLHPKYISYLNTFPSNIQKSFNLTAAKVYYTGNVSKQAIYNWENNTFISQNTYFSSNGSSENLKQNIQKNLLFIEMNKANGEAFQQINSDSAALYMIPQTVAANSFKMDVILNEKTHYNMTVGGSYDVVFQRNFTINFPTLNWNRGQKIGYQFSIDPTTSLNTISWVKHVVVNGQDYIEVDLAAGGFTDIAYYPNGPQSGSQGIAVGNLPLSAHFLIALTDIQGRYNSCPPGWRAPTLREYQLMFALNGIMNSLNIPGFVRLSFDSSNTTFINRVYNYVNSDKWQGKIYTINFFTGANNLIRRNGINWVRCIKDFAN